MKKLALAMVLVLLLGTVTAFAGTMVLPAGKALKDAF